MRFPHALWIGPTVLVLGCTAPPGGGEVAHTPSSGGPLDHQVLADDGHPLTVWEKRPASAVRGSVLLLHGRTWSARPDFDLQVEERDLSLMDGLVQAGFAVYALDARGYGATARDSTGWLTPNRMADDVIAVLAWVAEREAEARAGAPEPEQASRKPAAAALFGWSFGSTVAHLAAQRRPDLVAGVALFGYWKDPDRTLPGQEAPAEPPRVATTAEAAASDFITPGSISAEAVQAYVEAALVADPVRVDIAGLDQFNQLDPAALTVPVMVLQGEYDPIAPADVQRRLFQRLGTGDREWVVLGGCDHAAFLERCRPRFLRALVGFLGEVTGSGRRAPS